MKKHYYFTSMPDTGSVVFRLLSNQTFLRSTRDSPEGEQVPLPTKDNLIVDPSKNLMNASLRSVFATDSLVPKGNTFVVGEVWLVAGSSLSDDIKEASEELKREYEAWVTNPTELTDNSKPTVLSKLLSRYPVPKLEDCDFHINPMTWSILLRNFKQGINTMLVGPTGSGKTELVQLVAKTIGMSLPEENIFDMGQMHDPISGLLGVHRLKNEDSQVVSKFEYAHFTQAVQQRGIVMLDELNRASAVANNILFPCLDNRKSLAVEVAGEEDVRNIKVHEGCVFVATANIGGEYSGTNQLDRALQDRFFLVELDYLTVPQETDVLVNNTGINRDRAAVIAKVCEGIRLNYRRGSLSTAVSTRHAVMVANMVTHGFTLADALQYCLLPLFEGTKTEGERATVVTIISSH